MSNQNKVELKKVPKKSVASEESDAETDFSAMKYSDLWEYGVEHGLINEDHSKYKVIYARYIYKQTLEKYLTNFVDADKKGKAEINDKFNKKLSEKLSSQRKFVDNEERKSKFVDNEERKSKFADNEERRGKFVENEERKSKFADNEERKSKFADNEEKRSKFADNEEKRGKFVENEERRGKFVDNEEKRGKFVDTNKSSHRHNKVKISRDDDSDAELTEKSPKNKQSSPKNKQPPLKREINIRRANVPHITKTKTSMPQKEFNSELKKKWVIAQNDKLINKNYKFRPVFYSFITPDELTQFLDIYNRSPYNKREAFSKDFNKQIRQFMPGNLFASESITTNSSYKFLFTKANRIGLLNNVTFNFSLPKIVSGSELASYICVYLNSSDAMKALLRKGLMEKMGKAFDKSLNEKSSHSDLIKYGKSIDFFGEQIDEFKQELEDFISERDLRNFFKTLQYLSGNEKDHRCYLFYMIFNLFVNNNRKSNEQVTIRHGYNNPAEEEEEDEEEEEEKKDNDEEGGEEEEE